MSELSPPPPEPDAREATKPRSTAPDPDTANDAPGIAEPSAPASGLRTLVLGVAITLAVLVAAGGLAMSGGTDGVPLAGDGDEPASESGSPADPDATDPVPGDSPTEELPPQEGEDDAASGQSGTLDGDRGGATLQDRVSPSEEAPLPDVELEGFAGGSPVDLASYRGEPLILNFWASWCDPCVREMPELAEVDDERDDIALLGVNLQDETAAADELARDLGITYDLATDDGDLFDEVDAFGMPTTLLVDEEGTIRYRHTGSLDATQLNALIASHLD